MSELFAEEVAYVEVALPVPLRRVFTYKLPPSLRALGVPGARVAVPFSGRKLPGVVVGLRDAPPEGVKRVLSVQGGLEAEPIFPEELLQFLREAAAYYLHPLGEVLRAAAPAVSTKALRALRKGGFLDDGESLPGRRVGFRTTWTATLTDRASDPEGRLGPKQRLVLELLREHGKLTVEALRDHVRDPRGILKKLRDRDLVHIEESQVLADPFFGAPVERDTPPKPTGAQAEAIATLVASLPGADVELRSFLLYGVTGSGKTEVYLRVIDEATRRGLGALLLVPEIALTPQLVARFRARFGDAIAVLHSGLSEAERDAAWRRLRRGEVRMAIGARSALFAPVPNLGIVVVDEEHDPSFKQEEGFRYQARDMALLRAHRAGAVCVLGSATPSVESYWLAKEGRLRLLELPERATSQRLPEVEIVDLTRHRGTPSGHPLISGPLHQAIERCMAEEGQAILFLNRRGFAPSVRCEACGLVVQCPACSVALTEHRRAQVMRCHYCDFSRRWADACPSCHAEELTRLGLGTEKLEDALAEVFAPARVARLDRDTASGRSLETVLDRLRRREIDILVGTQMVTKGHDLPGVTLVGVVLADQSLAFPDFRASERTFQLLCQVSGRAGRGDRAGRVVLQTFQPDHSAIVRASRHDYRGFFEREIIDRKELSYAPFARLVAVRVDAGEEDCARAAADQIARAAHRHPRGAVVRVLGPAPAPIARLRGRFRYRVLLRSPDRRALREVAAALLGRIEQGLGGARAIVDVDPVSML